MQANPTDAKRTIAQSIERLQSWVVANDYQAYDPGDGELSFLRYATLNTHFLRRLLTASVLRVPFHIRPLIGIRPHRSTKGMGYLGWGYVKLYASAGDESYRRGAEFCFDWLAENRSPGYEQYGWGNSFAFATRAGTIPRYMPTIVWSSLVALAFVEAYEVLGRQDYLDIAASTAEWVKKLPREETATGCCLSYVPHRQSSIHNSNMLGASLLARVGSHTGDRSALELAKEAMRYSCTRQRPDGAWFYGEAANNHWIDNFHTGYNLDSMKRYQDSTGDLEFEPYFKLGYQYFKHNFFEETGRPKYYHNKAMPIDIQCCAQAIDTLAFLADSDPDFLPLSVHVAKWTIENMQAEDGHFYYRDLGWMKVKTPMFHWGQGTMFKALANLLAKLDGVTAPKTLAGAASLQSAR